MRAAAAVVSLESDSGEQPLLGVDQVAAGAGGGGTVLVACGTRQNVRVWLPWQDG
jgi:hypothetical protein